MYAQAYILSRTRFQNVYTRSIHIQNISLGAKYCVVGPFTDNRSLLPILILHEPRVVGCTLTRCAFHKDCKWRTTNSWLRHGRSAHRRQWCRPQAMVYTTNSGTHRRSWHAPRMEACTTLVAHTKHSGSAETCTTLWRAPVTMVHPTDGVRVTPWRMPEWTTDKDPQLRTL